MPEIKIHRDELQYLSGYTSWNCCIGLEVALPCKDQLTSLCEKRLAALDEQGVLHLDLALQHCLQVIQRSLQSLCIGFVSADGEDRVLLHVGEREYVLRYYDHQSGDVRMAADRLQTLPFVLQACGALLCPMATEGHYAFSPRQITEIRHSAPAAKDADVYQALRNDAYVRIEPIRTQAQEPLECHIFKRDGKGAWKLSKKQEMITVIGCTRADVAALLESMLERRGIEW